MVTPKRKSLFLPRKGNAILLQILRTLQQHPNLHLQFKRDLQWLHPAMHWRQRKSLISRTVRIRTLRRSGLLVRSPAYSSLTGLCISVPLYSLPFPSCHSTDHMSSICPVLGANTPSSSRHTRTHQAHNNGNPTTRHLPRDSQPRRLPPYPARFADGDIACPALRPRPSGCGGEEVGRSAR